MIEENEREEQTKLTQEDIAPAALCPDGEEEPQEIVSWYTPESGAKEIVECYVHPSPLPERLRSKTAPRAQTDVWRQAAEREKKRRRRGLWIFLACMAVLIGVIVGSVALHKGNDDGDDRLPGGDFVLPGGEEGNASSIVDITRDKNTAIPRCAGDPSVRLVIESTRGETLSAPELYTKVNPAVVTVVSDEGNNMGSIGTGVIMTADGYVITNAHVISGGKECMIVLDTGMSYEAKLVGYDMEEDLAVLKAQNAENLPVAAFGNSDELMVGETAYAIGNPLGVELRGTLTDGIISAVNREVEVDGGYMTMIQTTAALNNGNSGGPLINSSGQIVGINTLKMSGTGWEGEASVEGLGFAIPISSASFVINDLIAHGEFRGVPTIGITVITVPREDGNGTQVEVYSVEDNYGAQAAGVQEGDVILSADGQSIYQTSDLLAVRRGHIIGDTMHLKLLRNGQIVEADIVLYSSKER
ncbi:MAG: trypsin-like peptidase domain-containing protein [Oscillospiraceae bacterium]|nr:trypsin-like peptidase domain-containing protein [Oscillospiraceae bacterium]